jgi:hypothetical protein
VAALDACHDSHGAHQNRAAYLLFDAAIIIGCGCSLLAALLVPLLAALCTLLGIMDYDIGRCFPAAAWGWVKLGCHVANGVLGGDAVQLLGGSMMVSADA